MIQKYLFVSCIIKTAYNIWKTIFSVDFLDFVIKKKLLTLTKLKLAYFKMIIVYDKSRLKGKKLFVAEIILFRALTVHSVDCMPRPYFF